MDATLQLKNQNFNDQFKLKPVNVASDFIYPNILQVFMSYVIEK